MRRHHAFLILFATLAFGATAGAQFEQDQPLIIRRTPRGWLEVSDGIGPTAGGLPGGATNVMQLFRVAGQLSLNSQSGIEVSALRIQQLLPGNNGAISLNNPEADGIMVAYSMLDRDRSGGFPSVATVGGGVLKRPTKTPGTSRYTAGYQIGFESSLLRLVKFADLSAAARIIIYPGDGGHSMYVGTISMGIRIG